MTVIGSTHIDFSDGSQEAAREAVRDWFTRALAHRQEGGKIEAGIGFSQDASFCVYATLVHPEDRPGPDKPNMLILPAFVVEKYLDGWVLGDAPVVAGEGQDAVRTMVKNMQHGATMVRSVEASMMGCAPPGVTLN